MCVEKQHRPKMSRNQSNEAVCDVICNVIVRLGNANRWPDKPHVSRVWESRVKIELFYLYSPKGGGGVKRPWERWSFLVGKGCSLPPFQHLNYLLWWMYKCTSFWKGLYPPLATHRPPLPLPLKPRGQSWKCGARKEERGRTSAEVSR